MRRLPGWFDRHDGAQAVDGDRPLAAKGEGSKLSRALGGIREGVAVAPERDRVGLVFGAGASWVVRYSISQERAEAPAGTSSFQSWCSTGPNRSISIVRSQATDSTIPGRSSRWKNRKPRTTAATRHNAAATPPIRRGVFADGARAGAAGGGGSAARSAEPQLA